MLGTGAGVELEDGVLELALGDGELVELLGESTGVELDGEAVAGWVVRVVGVGVRVGVWVGLGAVRLPGAGVVGAG
ncbi:MAG TPA: hypothetical protein VE442_19905, partial [Jatrophihabitans sp.]|nr:hypothetical protein [Jatrophihabitans sp.]